METIYRDYAPKGVKFIYLYKALAHPEMRGYIKPHTLEERLMHITEARRTLGSEITWICDTMTNDLRHAIGNAPNSEFLLDPEGKIAGVRVWSDPGALRKDLEKLAGPVEKPTAVSDLNLKTAPPPNNAPTGVVAGLKLEGQYRALKAAPQLEKSEYPFYVKLRAEADGDFLDSGKGKLYVGFRLDPLYGVYWNNHLDPLRFEIHPPGGVSISPAEGQAPKVAEEADADPREFLLEVDRGDSKQPARMVFRYTVCSDQWGKCRSVTQEYLIGWEADRDGGRVAGRGPRRPPSSAEGRPQAGRPGDPGAFLTRLMQSDAHGAGRQSAPAAARDVNPRRPGNPGSPGPLR